MDPASLVRSLSSYVSTPATQQAAREFLDLPDPSAALDRIYSFLVWQRTLRTVLRHLEDTGADLDALVIAPETYRKTFFNYRPVWDLDTEPPITGKKLLEIYALHQSMLVEPVTDLVDAGVDRFVLVSGRAYQARYPHYDCRAEFDTDLVVPDVATAGAIASTLTRNGYHLDTVRVRRLGPHPVATVEIRKQEHGHLISVGLLVGGYHAHRGPIFESSEAVTLEGRPVAAARPEDLLVMLAARVESKRRFGMVNFNDAAVILESDGQKLDWEVVRREAAVADLEPTLAVIIERAQHMIGRPVVPDDVVPHLTATRRSRIVHHMGDGVAQTDLTFGAKSGRAARAQRRLWTIELRARLHQRDDESVLSKIVLRNQDRILKEQARRARSGAPTMRWDPMVKRLRPRCGAFCEVAPTGDVEGCVSHLGTWRVSSAARTLLRDAVEAFGSHTDSSDCMSLRFLLSTREGL